ncbi:MAG TPA: heavy-metal-associated domain-containing protein [Chloroflexia bacterium]|nr:heavy-metal-associated domain-containing protein [Chloroflexia bacterium]
MTQVTLNVPDISCAHCEKTILEALRGKDGVQAVVVSIPTKHVLLKYDESRISLGQVEEILDEEGYPVASTQS